MTRCKTRRVCFQTASESSIQSHPTKRAPDAGDSAHIPSSFLRLSLFPVGRMSQVHVKGQVDLLNIFWWTDESSPRTGAGRFAKPFSGGRMSQVHAPGQVDLLSIFLVDG